MSKPKTKVAPAAARPRGRPRGEQPPPGVTGVRIPPDDLAALDAWVEEMNTNTPAMRATRSSLLLHIIREALKVRAAAKGAS